MSATVRVKPVHLRLSEEGLDLIAECEGFVGYAYDDADPKPVKTPITPANAHTLEGTLTGANGHTRTVKPGDTFTREQGRALLRADVREAESLVHRHVSVPLSQGEFDGMTDLFFNIGPGRRKGTLDVDDKGKNGIAVLGRVDGAPPSTLLLELNRPSVDDINYRRAAECFTQWRMPGSVFEWGLTRRRIKFRLVFMGLPIKRASNLMPGVMPATAEGLVALERACVAAAREEAADLAALEIRQAPAPQPAPEPQPEPPAEIVLDTPLPPPAPPPAPPIVAAPAAAPPVVAEPPPVSPPPASPTPKNPAKSSTIWGILIVVMAPQLEAVGNELLAHSAVGGAVGKLLMALGTILVVLGRISATQPLSMAAPLRKSP